MRTFLLSLLLFGIGLASGWYLRDLRETGRHLAVPVPAPLPAAPAIAPDDVSPRTSGDEFHQFVSTHSSESAAARLDALAAFEQANGESFDTVMYRAACHLELDLPRQAVDDLLAAALLVRTAGDEAALEAKLGEATDRAARELIAANRFGELDRIYENITLALPELPVYFLELGLLRLRAGDPDSALSPLAQIQNHPQYGAQARELIAKAAASDTFDSASLEEVPLRVAGTQFIVDALVDDGRHVSLLIDTGAAMTVLDADVLERLGYALSGRREYFATASGVVEAPVVTLGRLSLGGTGISQLAVGGLQLPLPAGIDGLLGMNFLRHFQFRIDQDEGVLHLETMRPPQS
ncbi:MAG: retroviral-like aspartic protease family protein [Pseudomonadales bacterium]|nr:retroviral-like aspartic protease family protein [Pseudomonadales bacterium]